ncbi:MAG: glyoxylate/hydroxypyruvate reductase A [Xanthomonadales bacterium]|nr:glyoxylate/hydroxypyruvate reductase A [Xanthomonadales bacterium]
MSLALVLPNRDTSELEAALAKALPDTRIQVWPEITQPESVIFAVAWKQPPDVWSSMPKLQAVMSYGAGVDFLLTDPSLPESVQVGRFVDPGLARQIAGYVLGAVLYELRDFKRYAHDQRRRRWNPASTPVSAQIGILGLGEVGRSVARHFVELGFSVIGWRARQQPVENVEVVTGTSGLLHVARNSDYLVAALPATEATRGVIDKEVFRAMRARAVLINVGRGETVVDTDLIEALENGRPRGALLDVFTREPLPEEHPFWHHPNIRITPHVAGLTDPAAAASAVVSAYTAVVTGGRMPNAVSRDRGY